LGSQWGALLAGTFIVESIFDRPGLGTAWIQAVLQRDYPMIEGATFIGASSCLLGMFAGDFLQRWWDPRSHRENSQL
jgi:peptide/nickel transport system permease protein